MIEAIIFDFDGVIVENSAVKTNAFYEIYEPYGRKIAEKVVDFHVNNGGVSRFEKFKFFHDKFLGISLSSIEIQQLIDEFSAIIFASINRLKLVKGVEFFLEKEYLNYKMFISS